MAISDTLKQKAGPLPVWAWGLIIGVGIVAVMYWNSSRSAVSSASSGDPSVAYPDLTGSADGLGANSSSGGGVTEVGGVQQFASNLAWETYVIARLVSQGYSPLTVQTALERYLKGLSLSSDQQAIVNLAISRYGLPPNGSDTTPVLDPVKEPQSVAISAPNVQGVTRTVRTSEQINEHFANTAPISTGNPNTVSFQGVIYTIPTGGYTTTNSITGAMRIHNADGSVQKEVGGSSGSSAPSISRGTRTTAEPTTTYQTFGTVSGVPKTILLG